MKKKIILFISILLLSIGQLSANGAPSFLLKADDTTSFMNYEFHSLAYEAAVKSNYEDSFRIYQKIANKGDDRAEYNIGMMYMEGIGVESKKMSAYKWLRRAANHGNNEATMFFKQMDERYADQQEKQKRVDAEKKENLEKVENVKNVEPEKIEDNISEPIVVEEKAVIPPVINIKKVSPKKDESLILLYIIIALIILIIAIAVYLVKKSSSAKLKNETAPQTGLRYKSQMFDITQAHISNYHNALLKHIDLENIKSDKKKMQGYYMFLAGVIDYYSQLEKFTESEQRRVFNNHMGLVEGKEKLTPITQSILEGQRDHSMYHFQAAGGVSAKEWHDNKTSSALAMLNKMLKEEH